MDIFRQKWHDEISNENKKLRTYQKFKKDFKKELYLDTIRDRNKCIILTNFRVSSHTLHIETGRHTKPHPTPESERKCTQCRLDEIENECHFLIRCSHYEESRNEMFQTAEKYCSSFPHMNSDEKFHFIMENTERPVIFSLANFLYTSFKRRNCTAPT